MDKYIKTVEDDSAVLHINTCSKVKSSSPGIPLENAYGAAAFNVCDR
jgi:hypothetical protein